MGEIIREVDCEVVEWGGGSWYGFKSKRSEL